MYIVPEVLYGVLHPKADNNGLKKKKMLELTIMPNCCKQIYNLIYLGNENHLGKNEIAYFLTSTEVTTDKTESWQPWTAAYVSMEIDDHLPAVILTAYGRQGREPMRSSMATLRVRLGTEMGRLYLIHDLYLGGAR